jgi:putative nucleotidyltransferase with HDIG domain
MSSSEVQSPSQTHAGLLAPPASALRGELISVLEGALGTHFVVLDGDTGELLYTGGGAPAWDWGLRAELCREVARRGRPEFIYDEDPFLALAIPLGSAEGRPCVAVATFVARPVGPDEDLSAAAELLGMQAEDASRWASQQTAWSPEVLQHLSELVLAQWDGRRRIAELEQEARSLSMHLASSYEEISLLYRLTQNLRISESDEELGRVALEWLEEVLPAQGLALQLLPVARRDQSLSHEVRTAPVLLTHGQCPLDNRQFTALLERVAAGAASRPVVVNRSITAQEDWPCPQVRQMIAVPLAEGENLFGWLAALNHVEDGEFGTVEASLLSSVAAILGIHSGNIELYRQQSELLAGIVRALTSAIDAKDPYTCGHSDRVARVAVRLAEELGCDAQTLNMMYLSGLLHDIGKIGIDDSVLRKPDKLSAEEYEHIKRHVVIGHRILRDLSKLEAILPVVLHHHESWDGGGYPEKLVSERIPLSARIVAVADAYDAMRSDRPYRQGMPDEKVDDIFRAGAGKQWDPQVVEAFFRARDDIRQISRTQQVEIQVTAQHCT